MVVSSQDAVQLPGAIQGGVITWQDYDFCINEGCAKTNIYSPPPHTHTQYTSASV